jgi:hypothetical protein
MQHAGRFGRSGDARQAQASKDKEDEDTAHRSALYLPSHERVMNTALRLRPAMSMQAIENIAYSWPQHESGRMRVSNLLAVLTVPATGQPPVADDHGVWQLSTRPSRVAPFPYFPVSSTAASKSTAQAALRHNSLADTGQIRRILP